MDTTNKPRIMILASNNQHKVEEFQAMIGKEWNVKALSSLDTPISWEEDGNTFEDNARIKALAVRKYSAHAIIADDSGLAVDALGGRPGIRSSRYGGIEGDDENNNKKLLQELADKTSENRSAAFVCCLVFIDEQSRESVYEGRCVGTIGFEPHGEHGFGYDPLFVPTGEVQTMAELSPAKKNTISHRAKAINAWINDQ